MTENTYDFRVGDKVTFINSEYNYYKEGVIHKIHYKSYFPIRVIFKDGYHLFTIDGNYHDYDEKRSLFHGHNLDIEVKEKKPERKKKMYGFTYKHKDGDEIFNDVHHDKMSLKSRYHFAKYQSSIQILTDIFEYEVDN